MQLDQIFTGAFEWLSGPLGTGLAIFMLIFGGLTFWAFSNVAIWDDAEDNIGNEAFWVSMVVFVPFIGIPLYALVRLLLVRLRQRLLNVIDADEMARLVIEALESSGRVTRSCA